MAGTMAVALAVAACGAGEDPAVETAGTTAPGASAPVSTGGPGTLPGAVSPPISTPAVAPRAHLTALRTSSDAARTRIVFEFDTVVPGYAIEFATRPVTEDGSGDEVSVAGDAVLEVRFENASQVRFEGERALRTYPGAARLDVRQPSVATEVVEAGDFEGVLRWMVGLKRRVPGVVVSTLTSPPRLVVELPPA